MDSNNPIKFKAISDFVLSVAPSFKGKNKPLALYERLISKTSISHEAPVQKHINAFRKFCVNNHSCISKGNFNFTDHKISYSDRVYIDMRAIVKSADKSETEIIRKHILTISALVYPEGNAKDLLKKSAGPKGNEADFLQGIMSQIENIATQDEGKGQDNPMAFVGNILQSGVFSQLVSGMSNGMDDGSLDMGKLMGIAQNMIGHLNPNNDAGSVEEVKDEGSDESREKEMVSKLKA